jgi:hypothetical protein
LPQQAKFEPSTLPLERKKYQPKASLKGTDLFIYFNICVKNKIVKLCQKKTHVLNIANDLFSRKQPKTFTKGQLGRLEIVTNMPTHNRQEENIPEDIKVAQGS